MAIYSSYKKFDVVFKTLGVSMPLKIGPKNSVFTFIPHDDLAFKINAGTLGEAIRQYDAHFDVTVVQHQEPAGAEVKYGEKYIHQDNKTDRSQLVDIPVIRGGFISYPKQDLNFVLPSDDLVNMGVLF